MLENKDKEKLDKYIDKIIAGLGKDAKSMIASGASDRQVIEQLTTITVNKFTPESKMIMSSVYNMLMENTFKKAIYERSENKAAFYQLDILSDLNKKIVFDVPTKIDYEESKKVIDTWVKGGAAGVVVVGGGISICVKSFIPVGISIAIAALFVGIMAYIINNNKKSNTNIQTIVDEYLNGIKTSIIAWIKSIEEFYDMKVASMEKEMNS